MSVFDSDAFRGHEQVVFGCDDETGLRAIIAIHNTNLGPALGGCRMWAYETENEAIRDVLRLSRGMTYKAAVAGLPLGGGKSVIIGDSRRLKTPELMQAMGRMVARLGGRYIIAEDVGTSVGDMAEIRKETDSVVGLPKDMCPEGAGGDPSPVTALGVFKGLKATVKHRLKTDDLTGVKVAVQGLGHVGYWLCKYLNDEGAELVVTDIMQENIDRVVSEFGAEVVEPDAIYGVKADVFAPCALGAIVNDETLAQMSFKVVAGAANNQLAKAEHGRKLMDMDVLYAPDYVINAGGLINVAYERQAMMTGSFNKVGRDNHLERIAEALTDIFEMSDRDGVPTSVAADRVAEERFLNPGKGMTDGLVIAA